MLMADLARDGRKRAMGVERYMTRSGKVSGRSTIRGRAVLAFRSLAISMVELVLAACSVCSKDGCPVSRLILLIVEGGGTNKTQ
jgi:hypothetical protein